MKNFRPSSWQKQARERGDMLYDRLINGDWEADERHITKWFALGYSYGFNMSKQRRKYVEQRAAKRVNRLINKLMDKEG